MSTIAFQSLPPATGAATRLATALGLACEDIDLHHFPDGELRITIGPGADTVILYAALDQPNEKLIALLLASEALRRAGAKRLVLVAPYLCYMRQDAAFHPGEAISQRAIGALLANNFDRVITFDAHLHRTSSLAKVFPGAEADNLSAAPAIEALLRGEGVDATTVVVGPDEESRSWVADIARRLRLNYCVAQKVRESDQSVRITFAEPKIFTGRRVIFIDDIISSGGTLTACAQALTAAGATSIDVIVVHALFPHPLMITFGRAGVRSVRSTNSVPHPTNAISLNELLARALRDGAAGVSESGDV